MRDPVAVVRDMIGGLPLVDDLEADHRADALGWLSDTADIFRRVKPATPGKHLVSYVVPVDPADGGILLVDHVNAGLWLPPGGHVEPGEHPRRTAVREVREELGLDVGDGLGEEPFFLTVTRTVGIDAGHTDVSLWFLLRLDRGAAVEPDRREFHGVRWWSRAELRAADRTRFDPHFFRFVDKLGAYGKRSATP